MAEYGQPPPGGEAMQQPGAPGADKVIPRDRPEVEASRAELVNKLLEQIKEGKKFWEKRFNRMRADAKFARGNQYAGEGDDSAETEMLDLRYKANITLRHINQRVSAIYAKNPRVVARRRRRMDWKVWDGNLETLNKAQQSMQAVLAPQPQVDPQTGAMAPPAPPSMDPMQAGAILKDFKEGQERRDLFNKIGKTLEYLAQYTLDEPIPNFKTQLKQLVRRVLTCKYGYVKLSYQRVLGTTPELDAKMKDISGRIASIEQLTADIADGEIQEGEAPVERLRLELTALQKQAESVLREGVIFQFPRSWSIIVDPCVQQLKGFVGAEWIAQEYLFTPDKVKQLFKIDLGKNYNAYTRAGVKGDRRKREERLCACYEYYDLISQMRYWVIDGYPDFVGEPGEPDVQLEQFHPYYVLSFNDVEDEDDVMPVSEVEQLRPLNEEYNRRREAARQHRIANRPAWFTTKGVAESEIEKNTIKDHEAHEVIALNVKPDELEKAFIAKPTQEITAELYAVEDIFVDVQRVSGDQPANLGGVSGTSATESTIAETTRSTGIQSQVDDLDDFLSAVMRGVGEILLLEMDPQTVTRIVGPGAVWPDFSRQDAAEELFLEIKAGSSGRPNRQIKIQSIERLAPFILQIPGLSPEWLIEYILTEMDEGIELEDAMAAGTPSIMALNSMAGGEVGGVNQAAPTVPQGQGAQGKANAQKPGESQAKPQGMFRMAPGATAGNEVAALPG